MRGEDSQPLRAWVDYFRDLGIHDFYRRGEAVFAAPETAQEAGIDELAHGTVPDRELRMLQLEGPAATRRAPPLSAGLMGPEIVKFISFDKLAPRPAGSIPAEERAAALRAISDEIGDCTRCPLAYAGRRKIVFGDGSPTARLMFVGEGPGADEDVQGVPFVGKAGQLLNNMIAAMGLQRAEVYIANIVKCRPPNNRVPEPVEANTCAQFLLRQIDVVQPEVIVALGATAATYLLGVKQSLSSLRGRWHSCRGAKLAVTYHPAYLLRDPNQKGEAWKDLQMVMAELGLKLPRH
jgi:DNA polymerase